MALYVTVVRGGLEAHPNGCFILIMLEKEPVSDENYLHVIHFPQDNITSSALGGLCVALS